MHKVTSAKIYLSFMFNLKLKLFLLFLLFGLISGQAALAQTSNLTPGSCTDFYNQFNLQTQVTVNGAKENSGNFVQGLPIECSASALIIFVINLALALSGIVAIAFLMIGGYFYLTAAGNEEQSEKGKKVLTNAVLGLAVIILSTLIVRIVASTLVTNLGGGANNAPAGQAPPTSPNPPPAATSCTGTAYSCISGTQTTAFLADQKDVLGPLVVFNYSNGVQVTSTITKDKQIALVELKAYCGDSPALTFFRVNLDNTEIPAGSASYTVGDSLTLSTTLTSPSPVPSGNYFKVYACGNNFMRTPAQ